MNRPLRRKVIESLSWRLLLVCALIVPAWCAYAQESIDDVRAWAITDVAIIDLDTGAIAPDQTILIQNGVIRSIGNRGEIELPAGAATVSYAGHFAIPGLWDMHVHFRGGRNLIGANANWLGQYLGFGVTAVRETGGDLPHSVLHWRDQIAAGERLGPRIFTALQKLDGVEPRQPGSIPIDSAGAIDAALAYLSLAGADFLKLYDMSLPPELFLDAIRKAEAQGLETAAHVPLYVPLREAIDNGLDSVEHIFFFVKAANPKDRARSGAQPLLEPYDTIEYLDLYAAFGDEVDETYARETFRRMAARDVAIVPTLAIEDAIESIVREGRLGWPRADQTPSAIQETLDDSARGLIGVSEAWLRSAETFWTHAERFLPIARDEGVTILAGSDTGTGNPGVYPGDSLHAELAALVDHGLTPLEALRAATREAARWMGLAGRLGEISPRAEADIVILRSNPLLDIANSRSIAAVVQQGVLFDESELAELKRLGSADASPAGR